MSKTLVFCDCILKVGYRVFENWAYHTFEMMRRLNHHVQVTDNLDGGKPQRPEPYKFNEI